MNKKTNNILSEISLHELLHAINILGNDIDVYVDGYDLIAVYPPVKLTPEAKKTFEVTLNTRVFVSYENGYHNLTYVCGVRESEDDCAYHFLSMLSGNCPSKQYDEWFNGPKAELL